MAESLRTATPALEADAGEDRERGVRRGWPVLLAASIGIAFGTTPVPVNVLGFLTPSLQNEFGWGRSFVMGAIGIVGVTNACMTPAYGWMIDRFGVRRVALFSLMGFGLSWGAIGATNGDRSVFYAQWFVMGMLGAASQPISWTRAVVSWFARSRGLALGLVLSGTGISSFVLNALAPALVTRFGWRSAILGTALLPLLLALPLATALFFEPPAQKSNRIGSTDPVSGVAARAAFHSWRYWLLAAVLFAIASAYVGLFANYALLLIDHGYPFERAGLITGIFGFSIIGGRLVAGFLFDQYWAPLVAAPFIASPIGTCWFLSGMHVSPIQAMAGAAMLGLAAGVEGDLISFLVARYFGLRAYGTLYGVLFGIFGIGAALSPALYGWVHDRFSSYDPALWIAAAMFLGSALLLLCLGPYPSIDA